MDGALNSLTSSGMLAASFSALGAGARFAEIGKRDIWSSQQRSLDRPEVTYTLVALDFVPPSHIAVLCSTLACTMAAGDTATLVPLQAHALSAARSAMRHMMHAAHCPS